MTRDDFDTVINGLMFGVVLVFLGWILFFVAGDCTGARLQPLLAAVAR